MSSLKVINRKQLPNKLPIWPSITLWLFLREINASELWWGICICLFSIIWIATIVVLIKEKQVEIEL